MERVRGLVAAVAALPCLVLPGCTSTSHRDRPAEPVHVVILHTNDLHGQCEALPAPWSDVRPAPRVGGLVRLAAAIRSELRETPEAFVVDAGDWFRGTPEGGLENGLDFTRALSLVGFDALCVGNHELDHGVAELERILAETRLPAVVANVRDPARAAGLRGTDPWRVVERGGLEIAFVGLLTPLTPEITHRDAERLEFEPPAAAWDRASAELGESVDLIVPLAHLSVDEARALARECPEIPLIVSGHSHTRLEAGEREGRTLIVQAGAKAAALGRVDLWLDRSSGEVVRSEARLIDLGDSFDAAPSTPAGEACALMREEVSVELDEVVGVLEASCERGRHRFSTPQGNWICDALLRRTGADVAIQNKGGTRADLEAGPLRRRHFFDLIPFDNNVVSLTLSGSAIEAVVRRGIEDTRHTGIEVGGMKVYVRPGAGEELLLERIEIAGEPIETAREYRLATSSYLADGGNGWFELRQGTARRDDPVLMRDLLEEEVRNEGSFRAPVEDRIVLVQRP